MTSDNKILNKYLKIEIIVEFYCNEKQLPLTIYFNTYYSISSNLHRGLNIIKQIYLRAFVIIILLKSLRIQII